jgi:hypothetical protein
MAAAGGDQGAGADSSMSPVETEGQGDTASTGESVDSQVGEGGGAPQPSTTPDPDELLSADEIAALQNNPAALQKALQRSYTQKTQALAPYRRLIDEMRRDPRSTLLALNKQYGISVQDTPQQAAMAQGHAQAEPAVNQILQQVESAFGPEGARAMIPLLNQLVTNAVQGSVRPIQQQLEATRAEAVQEGVRSTLDQMTSAHPDWKQFEPKIVELGRRLQPVLDSDVSMFEYMEHLYHMAKRTQDVSNTAATLVKRTNNSVAASEPRPRTASSSSVQGSSQKHLPTLRESFEAAMKGQSLG